MSFFQRGRTSRGRSGSEGQQMVTVYLSVCGRVTVVKPEVHQKLRTESSDL